MDPDEVLGYVGRKRDIMVTGELLPLLYRLAEG
jgi:hypothetical protein